MEDTQAAPAPEPETEIVPPATAAAPDLAWSADESEDIDAPQRHGWRTAWVVAGSMVACSAVLAAVFGVSAWATHHHNDQSVPAAPSSAPVVEPVHTSRIPAAATRYHRPRRSILTRGS